MIQLVGSILIWISLGIGTLAAVTAYRPLLDTAAQSAVPLTLGMPVGLAPAEQGNEEERTPLYEPPMAITAEMIDTLRKQDVTRIGVKEFSLRRWNEKYWFFGSLAGLVVGAMLVRQGAASSDISVEGSDRANDPIDALAQAAVEIGKLTAEVTDPNATDRLQKISETIDQIRRTHLDAFTSGGPRLTRQLGLSGFARLMDAFAAAERKLNRAWSAAVDGNEVESLDCLRDGQEMLGEAMKRLDSLEET